jgi:hypothetical protein
MKTVPPTPLVRGIKEGKLPSSLNQFIKLLSIVHMSKNYLS